MKKYLFLMILFFLLPVIDIQAEKKLVINIFAIHSNVVKSWIQYSIKLTNDWKFIGNEPVFGFRKRPSGSRRELSYFERRYYGIESQTIINDFSIEITLKALPLKKITIEIRNDKATPYIDINGKRCVFTSAIINAKKDLFSTYTGYVDITGIDVESKNIVTERIYE